MLFASLASGSLLALVLFYLSPLPILIAGIGWNYLAGLVAALFAAACLAVVLDSHFALAFIVGVGLPAWWLGYLALLARPDGTGTLEWYPPGRIVLWTALAGAAAIVIAIPFFGTDAQSFHTNLQSAIEAALGLRSRAGGEISPDKLINTDVLTKLAPPMVASLTTVVLLINTWLAARIVKLSGQLRRPWPELPAIGLPRFAPLLLAMATGRRLFAGPARHRFGRFRRRVDHGFRRSRLRRAACGHAQHRWPAARSGRRLYRGHRLRMAGDHSRAARSRRHGARPARPRQPAPAARPHCNNNTYQHIEEDGEKPWK